MLIHELLKVLSRRVPDKNKERSAQPRKVIFRVEFCYPIGFGEHVDADKGVNIHHQAQKHHNMQYIWSDQNERVK